MTAEEIVNWLDLKQHPEGGFYRETFRDSAGPSGRSHSTAIYHLLRAGQISRWHRVDAAKIRHWYVGDALELSIGQDAGRASGRAWPGSGTRDAPASRSTGAKLARRSVFGRLYASRLHCGAGCRVFPIRDRE
jgi:predicted cupin superfamily sugar epimerase